MKRKLNIKKLIIFIVVVLTIVYGSYKAIREYKYSGSVEGKLTLKNYSEEEIKILTESLEEKETNEVLKKDYNKNYVLFIKEKYFIFDNLDEYLKYQEKNKKEKPSKIVALVNVNAHEEWYEKEIETDTSKDELMLVNKYYTLKENYVPKDLEEVGTFYAYDGVSIKKEVLSAFQELCDAAKGYGYTFVTSLGYRSYDEQYKIYYNYKSYNGSREADKVVAHAGNSEHQTGLALEIEPFDKVVEDISKSEEHKWLLRNAYKYGFILRYPENKEDITGFSYEPWHFRYVGVDVASKINKEKITYDEYYAYYIEG